MISIKAQIIKINPDVVDILKYDIITRILQEDGVIAYPTDTFYGLGVNCFSEAAIKKIYMLKERTRAKPLSVVISDLGMLSRIAIEIPPLFWSLSKRFWPGPLTIILKASPQLPEALLAQGQSIGIRMPKFYWIQELIKRTNFPLTATSANISGKREISRPEKIIEIFGNKIDLIVDGGKTSGTLPSTVIDLTEKMPIILREGVIPRADLEKYMGASR